MKASLKSFFSVGVDDLENFHPVDSENFCFDLEMLVGPEEGQGMESFNMVVVTPKWLLENSSREEIIIGRHYLIVFEYDFERIINFLRNYIEQCTGNTWDEIAEKLARLGHWEFEDYQEYKEPDA